MGSALRPATARGAAAVLRRERTRTGGGGPLTGRAARRGPVGPPSVTPTETVKNRLRGGPAG
ncbi:hypothetical protein San01_15190 [Streptomyces angustmyceticus]|uniref:Uncharacterized protein n=1 Tax=Streptomyces angustmyceticus TaxID=285578 RepID=A0A5J4L9W1_9ACTN|nr:hypothetical protein San01_15190 [Streptomyces angustmyceticus]